MHIATFYILSLALDALISPRLLTDDRISVVYDLLVSARSHLPPLPNGDGFLLRLALDAAIDATMLCDDGAMLEPISKAYMLACAADNAIDAAATANAQ